MPDAPKPPSGSMDFLHKQVGPLPIGGWLIVVGAGLGFSWWRKRNQNLNSTATSSDQLSPGFTDQTVGDVFSLVSALNKGTTGVGTATIGDNNTWYQTAVRNLLAKGYQPGLIDSALRKYMQGMSLSTAENAAVELALQLVGPLPSPPPPPTTTPGGGQPSPPSGMRSLSTYQVQDYGTVGQALQHLTTDQLLNASNITFGGFQGIGGGGFPASDRAQWSQVIATQYGTSDPLAFMNEIARRYQAGQITESNLTGPTGSWTNGQPAYVLSTQELNDRLKQLAAANPEQVQFS